MNDVKTAAPGGAVETPPVTMQLRWEGDHRFDVARPDQPGIRLDGDGATGPSPVDGLVAALASCAAVDVVDILAKRRTPAKTLEIEAIAQRVSTIPRRLKHVELRFRITGEGIDRANAERAIDLSINKYCSVRDSLSKDIPVEWTLELNGA